MEKFSLDRDWKFYNGDFELSKQKHIQNVIWQPKPAVQSVRHHRILTKAIGKP